MGSIVGSIFESVSDLFKALIVTFLKWVVSEFTTNTTLVPTVSNFTTLFFGGNSDNVKNILKLSANIGLTLVVVILVLNLGMFFLGIFVEIRDTWYQMILRGIFAAALVFIMPTILDYILDVGFSIFIKATDIASKLDGRSLGGILASAYADDKYFSGGIEGFIASSNVGISTDLVFGILKMVLDIILYLVLSYNLIKLAIEMIQRFLTIFALYMGMSAATSLIASALTQNCFFSYIQMFCCEIVMFIFAKIWLQFSVFVMGNVRANFIGIMGSIAFVRIGISIKEIIKGMGLSTANTGAMLLDNISTTAGAMAMMGRMATGGIKKSGNAAFALGAATGNGTLMKLGSLGGPMDDASILKKMNSSAASKVAGTKLTNDISSMLDSCIKDGNLKGFGTFTETLGNLSASDRQKYFNHVGNDLFGANGSGNTNNIGSKLAQGGNGLEITGFDTNKRAFTADLLNNGQKIGSGFISANSDPRAISSIEFNSEDGQKRFLNVDDVEKPTNGIIDGNEKDNSDDAVTMANICGIDTEKTSMDSKLSPEQLMYEQTNDGGYMVYNKDSATEGGNMDVVGAYDSKGNYNSGNAGYEESSRQFANEFKENTSNGTIGVEARPGAYSRSGLKIIPESVESSIEPHIQGNTWTFAATNINGEKHEYRAINYARNKEAIDTDKRFVVINGLAIKRGRNLDKKADKRQGDK